MIALLLVLALCLTMLAACSSNKQAEPEAPAAPDTTDDGDGEIAEITFAMPDFMVKSATSQQMQTAVNELTESEIGVHVNFELWEGGDYSQNMTLALSGGETIDLACLTVIPGSDVATMHSQGELMDMTPYLTEEFAGDILEAAGEYLDAYTFSDGIFGVPNFRNFSGSHWIVMRQDVLDELGLSEEAQNMKTWEDFHALLTKIKEGTDLYAIAPSQGYTMVLKDFLPADILGGCDLNDGLSFDSLNDANRFLMADADGKVSAVDRDERRADQYRFLAQLYNEGLQYPDANAETSGEDLLKNNVAFSYVVDSDMSVETTKEQIIGYDLTCKAISHELLTTTQINCWGTGIPITAQEPAAAMKFLNLMFSNADLMNLLVYGIQDTDYVLTETGEATFPEGVDSSTVSWNGGNFLFGNQFLLHPWTGNGADFFERSMADLAEAPISEFMGFMPDTSNLTNEVAALTSVQGQYAIALASGLFTEELYSEFLDALDAAGIDSYISAIQQQLDDWRAAK